MASRPSTATSSSAGNQRKASKQPIQGALRPQSAALLLDSPSRQALQPQPTAPPSKGKVGASSEDLIRDLEHKVRKVVEQKRAESDKLRFALAKKREDVERTKLILQDLIKESEALGLHYQPLSSSTTASDNNSVNNNQNEEPPALSVRGGGFYYDGDGAPIVEEPSRLQPIASISRRPVYSKHSNINELEAKLEKRASETHQVHRRTLVLEHIKKRLLMERLDISQETNELKTQFADISHQTQELHKKDIAATEAVSQVQARLAQQKEEIAASERKYTHEVAMRHKWAREKAKFEKYYNDQVLTIEAKQSQQSQFNPLSVGHVNDSSKSPGNTTPSRRRSSRNGSPSHHQRKQSAFPPQEFADESCEQQQDEFRDAFLRIGFGQHAEGADPEEVIHVCLSHDELKKELDGKYEDELERVAQLRQSITKMRGVVMENNPLSKRGTSQKLENKELEISVVERSLATVVNQYMFVDQSVRPIKIGLQQILQNVTNETVNIDDMDSLEKALLESCEEMMRLIRESPDSEPSVDHEAHVSDAEDDDEASNYEGKNNEEDGHGDHKYGAGNSNSKETMSFSAENFTSPFNIRVPLKQRESYYVPGINQETVPKLGDHENEETDFDVMDRATVKRISSVLLCTSSGKKPKDKVVHMND